MLTSTTTSSSPRTPLPRAERLDDLVDWFSLVTGITSDSIICMTDQGQQLNEEVLQDLIDRSEDSSDVVSRSAKQ